MIKLKLIILSVIICSNLIVFGFAVSKSENISSWTTNNTVKSINFTCGDTNKDYSVFNSNCNLFSYCNSYFESICFTNCRYREIVNNFFKTFTNLQTFNISGVELETLQIKTLWDAKNLKTLIVSNNRLTEISPQLFINAVQIDYVDFSNNTIKRIDPSAFQDAINLKWMNLSHNQISQFNLSITSLQTLDLSHNKLTTLNDQRLFNELVNLKHLNLSYNSIGNLSVGIFAFLPNLEHLSLSHININTISMGTFSHQHKLTLLDLSGNALKTFDFNLFFPVLHDLQSLYLGENKIHELQNFRNAMLPTLTLLDIKNNNFNCLSLHRFMEMVDWTKLHLLVDPQTTKTQQAPNIRGVICVLNDTNQQPKDWEIRQSSISNVPDQSVNFDRNLNEAISKLSLNSKDDIKFVKISLVSICICVILLIVLLIFLSRSLLVKSTTVQVVKYSDQLVLE